MSEIIECSKTTECTPDCANYNKPVPPNQGTPLCRLLLKYRLEKNPVTKSVYFGIIQNRLGIHDESEIKSEIE